MLLAVQTIGPVGYLAVACQKVDRVPDREKGIVDCSGGDTFSPFRLSADLVRVAKWRFSAF